ncbi:ester cyclase [Mycobacterium sp. 852002-51961_SCH5331710]|uniref:ester cyclase n=1 Tax=Mycobacterium sp. 852002-51961_SCH5331710 TaxID=1834105 RepID=UPI00080171D6|nr:ester cyclase [Mycobacterium sp. 852002-51961_SCH5331710]OBB37209.1 ester cyclase [Mycobacterium sp. 852002-51961_SCH5331710]
MSERDLSAVYRDYLGCLNERRWSDLGIFVADRLSYNGKRMTLADYRALLEADTAATPDLLYDPEILLADDRFVACRLSFRCTPRHTFLGIEPTGRPVSFAEHVFYRFEAQRIVEVWSLIDKEAVREQMLRKA